MALRRDRYRSRKKLKVRSAILERRHNRETGAERKMEFRPHLANKEKIQGERKLRGSIRIPCFQYLKRHRKSFDPRLSKYK